MSGAFFKGIARAGLKSGATALGRGAAGRLLRALKGRGRTRRGKRGFRRGFNRTSGFYGRYRGNHAELKFHDRQLDEVSIPSAGVVSTSIHLIVQGTTESQRIGRRINIRSINWRFRIKLPQTTAVADTHDTIRVIMFLDKQANGTNATTAVILQTSSYQSFNNLANKMRFRTLMDRTYTLDSSAGAGSVTTYGIRVIDDTFYKKCNIPIEFSGPNGSITEIRSNNIAMLVISELNVISSFTSKVRVRYSDKG